MLDREEVVKLFERRREAWLAEDLERYLAFWADDMTFKSPVHDVTLEGKAAYEELLRKSATAVRPVAFDITTLAVHENRVLAEWRITLEWRKERKQINYTGMSSCTIQNGLIVDWHEYWNAGDMQIE